MVRRHVLVCRSKIVGLGKEANRIEAGRVLGQHAVGGRAKTYVDWKGRLLAMGKGEARLLKLSWDSVKRAKRTLRRTGRLRDGHGGRFVSRLRVALRCARDVPENSVSPIVHPVNLRVEARGSFPIHIVHRKESVPPFVDSDRLVLDDGAGCESVAASKNVDELVMGRCVVLGFLVGSRDPRQPVGKESRQSAVGVSGWVVDQHRDTPYVG